MRDTAHLPHMSRDVSTLIQEIYELRIQVCDLRKEGGSGGLLLQRFLSDSESYAGPLVDPNASCVSPQTNLSLQTNPSKQLEVDTESHFSQV